MIDLCAAHDMVCPHLAEIERLREALKRAETCIAFFRSLLAEHKQHTGSAFVLCCEEALEKYGLASAALHPAAAPAPELPPQDSVGSKPTIGGR